ncbi:peptidase C80 [Aeromonas hydrophila]|uniref:MARTX multifunctional-autoprocessing repeats-in-toxin holotoxin RtxA n=2 Tax=Aeromonas hydrophila TaxID=644 RepID=UPI000E580847|nr:MARTX multifunctional-autoprocessing repeats-in-toxin holotoxin RtxA [Aeromonas hydrophila]AXV35255.1 peptidase C80 [Aeromonas hydrophila]EHA1069000.1 MARTX multifunctional-autoprocessing repeats-in-toxin holotoxin RtxA [Aeromonas hydrophila]MBM0438706.1 MARTX multifunctional-autoprocessing repeats-in-toxin holotoxin RtxA [Aeromonas hydrophila subsp. ranae]MBW3827031.1 MARTX multifunctional-autoprocessing repeats-in-toxin holotoxin RtxA [Aeromonas hydrophila]MDD9230324.1 MARTX multifunction
MGKSVWRSIEYFFTGNYTADDGNNEIDAYGLGGVIHAYGGDDTIRVGSIGATVYTGTGNDSVYGGAAYLKVVDDSGNLTVKGAAGYADISKSQSGNVHFAGASGATNIDHQGRDGDIRYQGAALANFLTRKGISGNVSFEGAGGYNKLWHQTDRGDLSYSGAGAANKLDRTWHSQYQGSQGNIHFSGAGAANIISSQVESGNVTLNGAGAYNKVFRKGREGDVNFNGAGGWNELSRLRNEQDEYLQTRGDIRFNGAGGYNRLLSDVAEGNIHFKGAGGYNHLSRKGSDSDSSPFAGARADEIALTTATMGGSWINQSQAVTAIKSSLQPNTYLFAFFDGMYTKVNRVELSNDGANGALRYHATSWYKEGNHLDGLAGRQIDAGNGFVSTQTDGAYRLSDLVFERRERIKLEAVEADLTENSWINYGGGVNVAAADVTLSSAKMSGYAIFEDGTKVDVNAVKSRAQANTYVFAKQLGPYTKIVVVELANDRETGALKYLAKAWYKEGNHLAGLADKVISEHTGFTAMGTGGYSLSEVRYQLDTVTAVSDRLPATREFSSQPLLPRQQSGGKSKGDIFFDGAGGGNIIESDVTEGNIHFNGAGAANVLIKRGQRGDLVFRGAGLANVLVHQGAQGRMDVYAAGAANVLVRSGDGEYLARLLAYGNISVQQGRGDSQVVMLGGYNTHTQLGDGQGLWLAGGGFNLLTQVGNGRLDALSVGGANVLTKLGAGQLTAGLLGGANVLTHVTQGEEAADTRAVLLGGANVLTKKGNGKVQAILGGGANVLTQIGQGDTQALLLGAANVLTRVGDGDLSAVMLGGANVLTHVGNGDTLGVMGAAGNLFTKVGDGTAIAAMIGAGNLFTQIGQGDAWALMGGVANVFTKVGDGNALALMVAKANVFTHIGDGLTVALMLAQGNLATKVGNGMTLAAMVGNANVFTHVGAGETFAAMLGQANLFTKVGDGLTAALMIGKANVYSHIGNGTSLGLFAGELNVMTKVGSGTTLAALFGKANIVTHVGGGLTGVLALGKANIITKVGDDFLGAIAKADANVLTHVGNGTTAGVLWGKGNLLTKIGDGTTVGLLISEVGNVMTHVGAGSTIGLAKGRANLITKVGDGLVVQGAWGDVNLLTQVGNGDRYSFAKGRANVLTKVGDGREVAVLQGEANLVTQVGNGDGYTGAWGKANVITKVGDGRQVVLAKGDANIVTQVGKGDGYQALLGKANIVTRVGDGIQVTLAKGEVNQTTTVGDGLSVTAAYGKFNNNVKVGDGTTINLAWGDYNLNTKVGDGLNVAVMKGKGNANVQIGDGLDITAAYARHNVAIKIGNGDFYSLAIASSNTSSNKLGTLFDNIKQTLLGSAGNQAINYLVQGDEEGPLKAPQAASLGEVQGLSGFGLDEIGEVKSSLAGSLTGKVSQAGEHDEQAMDKALQLDEQGLARGGENLIVNGDFERGAHGWQHAGAGIEADFSAATYGLAADGHGARVSELSTDRNTQISQDLAGLKAGETVNLTFDFARRANISLQHGIEVLWNGERVFASEGDASSWQSKALTLTASEGRNTLAFRGIGESNGLGYLLDNVVATASGKAEIGQVSAQLAQDDNAARARGDQASADADKQRLEQEKGQQLAAIAGTQAQLEATDQHKLAQNGQDQRAAIEAESREMTAQLDTLARRFEQVRASDAASEPSGQHWRTGFADRLLSTVQEDLDDAGNTAGTAIEEARSRHEAQHQQLDTALAKSKTGQQRSEQLQGDAEAAGQQRAAQAEQRRLDALARQGEATSRQQQGEASASQAQLAGEQAASQAGLQANQAKQNAASLKQSGDKPTRQGVQSGPSTAAGQPLLQTGELDVPAVNTLSAPDEVPSSAIESATGLSEQEQSALDGALAAVNRLQINAEIRANGTPTITLPGMVGAREAGSTTVPASHASSRHSAELGLSGVSLVGLGSPVRGPAVAVPETAGFAFQLLKSGDSGFIDSTRRQLGKLSIDLPSERLKAVREAVVRVQQQPSEANLGLLEQSLTQWQTRDPKEFARRGEQVKALRFEAASLLSHTFASRAKSAGVYGLALPPEHTARFEDQLVFDGIGRIIGAVGELSATDIAKVSELGIRSLTETNSRAERQAPRTEHDSLIAFAHQLNQFDTPQTRQLAAEIKSLWLSGDVRGPRTIALFETASKMLGDYPQLQVLAQSLLADAQRSKATGQYIDNLFGRRFDSEIAHGLVTAPSQAALDTSAQLGSKLVKEFDDWIQTLQLDEATRTQRIDKKMAAFAEAIKKDTRPWFSRVPSLTEFLAEPTFANFKQMMTRVDNGFDVIKVPFLAVKMATHPELGMDTANWKREGDRFYGSVITKARSTSTEVASAKDGLLQVDLPGRTTSDYGTGLHYQPGGDKYEDFLNGRSVADGRILTPGKETTFERNALDKGLSVVTGASGSTNIMVHLNNYLAAKDPAYSPSQAYLNTLAFLVFDGGHSVNESLTVYRALQESGDARKQVLESYTANYRDLVDLAGEDSKASVQTALDGAFGRTLEFYQQHAYTAQLDELVALGTPRKGDTLADGELPAGSGKPVSVANDGSAPLDKQPLNPLTRFLNDNLYGTRDERRQVGDITRQLLDHAVSKGETEQVTLQGDAGRLSGYLHKGAEQPGTPQDGKPEVVLFLHGSGSSAEEQADAVRSHYQKQGVDMLAVNLRGYGTSDGGPSEQGVYQDARTMFRYLVEERGVAPGKILIHGYSMGGPIAADLARYAAEQGKPVGGLLLDRPMPSMSKAITAHELPNPGGLVGALAKAVNGRFSVEKNLDGLPKSTPIMLLTDNEGLGSEGEKLRAKLAVAGYQVSGEQTFYGHLASNRLMGQYAEQIVGDLFNRTPSAADIEAPLKGIEDIRRDLKRYQEALAPQVGSNGATRDIRTTKAFLAGYQQGLAGKVVEGFQPDMSMTQLVDLFVQPTLSPQQQGALAWEIENRALKSTIKPRIEQSNRLFRDVASQGGTDPHAREHLAPQLLLLNLADDGFGGRCDPLSKLVLVAKQLESEGQPDLARRMMEKLYSAAAVINNPDRYSATELDNARKLVGSLAEIHTNTPAAYNYDSLRSIKYDIVKEKWEGKNAISLDTVLTKLTAKGSDAPVLLELDAPGHAMAAWAKQGESGRIYGFYDPNAGIVEFSSAEKFSRYMTRFFGKEGLDMANGYHLKPGPDGKPLFFRVSEMNGAELARFKPSKDLANKVTLQEILQLPVFDESPMAPLPGKTVVTEHTAKLFADVYSPDELKKAAQVFAKPIGESYQQILDQLATLHGASGQAKVEAALRLNNLIDDYLVKHEGSGRNPALSKLQSQLHGNLYRGELASLQAEVTALAKTRPDLAAIVIGKATEEAQGQHPGLTQMVLRWATQDPYLAAKAGYQGGVPADLPFDARFHIALGEHHGDLKKWLTEAQGKGLLSRAVLDDTRKVLHLGYSYQELQDMTGEQSAQMAVYFIKEAAKQAAPGSELSAEHIMLDKFGDRRYLGELESRRIEQIENIYHSSKQTDVAAWDARYGGDALRTLNAQLDGDSTLAGQLARLLDNRNGLLIGETHGSDVNGLRFVNEQMDALKAQGVAVIGLEHLRGELAQPLIDRYLAGGEMSPELATMLKSKHLEPSLFERARERGMRIVALDDGSTARPVIGGTEHGLMYRAGAANNVAVDVLGKLPAGEKFVAIYGSAHLASHKGIEGFVPGITHRLGLPALKVDADNRFHLQADDVSQRVEYADVGRKWTPPAALDGADLPVRNQRVEQWQRPEVVPGSEGGETRFTSQIIIQTEDDPVAAKAAASLAGKHPDRSLVVQLDADGNYRVVYGDPAQLAGNIRWQVVGHGRDADGQNNSRLSGYSADELAGHLRRLGDRLQQEAGVTTKPSHISLVGCSLVSDDLQTGFARRFIQALDGEGIRTQVSARSSEVAVDQGGRKHTRDEADVWARKVAANKVVLTLDDAGEPVVHNERVRGGVAEGDIVLAKVGESESRARGAIADNDETFVAPDKQRQPETASSQADNAVSYSGNIQVNVGDGEFTALNWGTTNLGVKVGTGGMKSLAFGDNNVMVHIGDGDSKHSVDIAGYRALEGAQLFVGQRNVSFNLGRSNDLIVMLEKSIPTPPLVNPFGGAARIAGALQQIAGDGAKPDWVASQWDQWTLAGANKFVADMAGLDQTSSVEYGSLTRLDSDHERSSRGLKSDLEATLNKEFNKRISGGGQGEQGPLSRADKLRQANEKLVFNFAVAGQGADIQVTTGNWNFVFGDNIQAMLDTNLGSLFGLMTQEFTASGQAKTTFTFTPTDLPRQLQNRLLGRLAGVGADTTLADIFGVDYNARGQLVARDGAAIDAPALLQEMLGVIAEFGGDQLKSLTDPAKWLDQLKAGLDLGEDALSSFARSHGLQDEAPEEAKSGTVTVQQGNDAKPAALPAATEERAFGFNALSLPNLFATLFNRDKQAEVVALASNLKQNLTADLLNMKEQTFDFLRNSGHLQGDGDMHVSLGNYNFNWGGDGKDLGAYLGDNNNFWGGRGDDVFYATGTSNIFTGGAGQDTGIMMGRENMMFGGQGDDVAVLAGRVNRAFMGEGNDQAFIFGEEGIVEGGTGQDYLVTSGNYNQIDAGADQDFTVTIGHHNQIRLGEGDDFAMVFGNHNRLLAEHGNNQVKLMGYHATIRGGDGRDRLIADQVAKFSQLDGGAGDDLLVLGGYQNQFSGGTGVDSFVFSGAVIENLVQDIGKEDFIVFNDVSWRDLWFKRSGYDLQLLVNRHTDGTSEQGKFEQLGSATFSNYFADNRAQLVIGLGEQQADGERSYSALSHQAVDNLIQAMSSFAPEAGDMGLLNRLDSQANSLVQSAWGDVIQGKGRVA